MQLSELLDLIDSTISPRNQVPSACVHVTSTVHFFLLDQEDESNTGVSFFENLPPFADRDKYLEVSNPGCNETGIWKYGGCFISSETQCDVILLNPEKIAFVELKLNAKSVKPTLVLKHRKKGISQLSESITRLQNEFDQASPKWPFASMEAYLCTPKAYPKASSGYHELCRDFYDKFGVEIIETSNLPGSNTTITFP